jgi:ketosteroid isomerase-like protein
MPSLRQAPDVVRHFSEALFYSNHFMKKFFFVAIFLFVTILLANAQEKLTDKEKLVQKAVIDMFQALADRDIVKLKSNCTEDILLLENGAIWNLDTLVQKVSQNTAADFKRINTIEFIDTKISGKIAWTTYNNKAEITRNGKNSIVKWLETVILIKEDGSWKIKNLHSTLLSRN